MTNKEVPNRTDLDLGTAILEIASRIEVMGTPNPQRDPKYPRKSPPYIGPWHVVDISKADPDVGWPGQQIGVAKTKIEAEVIRTETIGAIAREELSLRGYQRAAKLEDAIALCIRYAERNGMKDWKIFRSLRKIVESPNDKA
jgi:hypothetical protein